MMANVRCLCVVILAAAVCAQTHAAPPQIASYSSGGKTVTYEVFGEDSAGPLVILLHGASGPGVPFQRHEAQTFADKRFTVLFLHYYDATGAASPSPKTYGIWVKAVEDLVAVCRAKPEWARRKIALMGFSLGSSIALAAGSQRVPVDAVADWYGSLPDEFFYSVKGMPPLLILHGERDPVIPVINAQQLIRLCTMAHLTCESHLYPDQGHGFDAAAMRDAEARTLDFFARTLR